LLFVEEFFHVFRQTAAASTNFLHPRVQPPLWHEAYELWHDWFETMSQVTYQTHRACEFLVQNAAASNGQHGPFDLRSWRDPSQGPKGSIDMDKLKQCLQSMDSTQAARVMHAVQTMQAMEDMLQRQKSRTNEAEGAAW
jgi:hypothetical protein